MKRKPQKTYEQMLDELRYDFPCEPDWVLEAVLAKHGWEKPVESAVGTEPVDKILAQ
ncbi:MAG TPA: hypothetical protein VGG80_07540 [Acidobacteriaceae bacterium]|jgi:hypothetical protein